MAVTPKGRTIDYTGPAPDAAVGTVTRSGLLATPSTGAGSDTADVIVFFEPADFGKMGQTGSNSRYVETVPKAAEAGDAGWIEPATPPYSES